MNTSDPQWRQTFLPPNATVDQAIRTLNRVSLKLVIVVDKMGVMQGTVSDGDIRRGLLKGVNLTDPLTKIMHHNPLVVPPELVREMVLKLMMANKIQQIPVVDENKRVIGLHVWDELSTIPARSNMMVIMAGGLGTRLLPHTKNLPKPLLPLAGKPMLEHIINRAKLEGFNHFVITIHYLGHMVEEHFGNGASLGVQIDYVREESPLGTAGALGLIKVPSEAPFLVSNCDIITDISYGALLDFHVRNAAAATMAVRMHEWRHPYGVVRTQGIEIVGFEEKPVSRTQINAGIYALNPASLQVLSAGTNCDMPTLFDRLLAKAQRAVAYPMHEPWSDVGRPDDLKLIEM